MKHDAQREKGSGMVVQICLSARHLFAAVTLVLALLGFGTMPAVAATNTSAQPQITVDPTNAHAGGDVNISGTGLAPGPVALKLASEILSPIDADEDGNLSTIIKIPQQLDAGQYRLTAQDSQHRQANTTLTIVEGNDDQSSTQLNLSANNTEVKVGDIIHLTLEGPEELLATLTTDHGSQALLPTSELTNTAGQKGQFSNAEMELVHSSRGSRVFQYVVPEYQPTINAFDDVGTVSPGAHFTFFTTIAASPDQPDEQSANITSNEVTIVVIGDRARQRSSQTAEPSLSVDRGTSTVQQFVSDPSGGGGVRHVVQGLAPNTSISYTVAGPTNVKALTKTATADSNGEVEFTIHGIKSVPAVAYVGDYTTFVSVAGQHTKLASHFSVTGQVFEGTTTNSDQIVPLGAHLASAGPSHTNLLFYTAALLAIAGGVVVYTNRRRLFGKRRAKQ